MRENIRMRLCAAATAVAAMATLAPAAGAAESTSSQSDGVVGSAASLSSGAEDAGLLSVISSGLEHLGLPAWLLGTDRPDLGSIVSSSESNEASEATAGTTDENLPTGTLVVRRAVWDAEKEAGHRLFDVTFPDATHVHFKLLDTYNPDTDQAFLDSVTEVAERNGLDVSAHL